MGQLLSWFRSVQILAEGVAKGVIIAAVLGSMIWFGLHADPAVTDRQATFADRILVWSFVVFSVGLAELFVLFVILTVLGKVDLPSMFFEKLGEGAVAVEAPVASAAAVAAEESEPSEKAGETAPKAAPPTPPTPPTPPIFSGPTSATDLKPMVSLSRLQAFMWTLVVMTVYFHRVVKDRSNGLPTIPAELLMVMGISGATYLISKNIAANAPVAKKGVAVGEDGKNPEVKNG